jgi:hypothetical protein
MTTLTISFAYALAAGAFLSAPSLAQDEEALKKDLTAVIALHGKPCGDVVAVKVLAESDFAASCKDGHKYRVYLNAEGRVIVDEQK